MTRNFLAIVPAALLVVSQAAGCGASASSAQTRPLPLTQGPNPSPTPTEPPITQGKIQHVVIIVQENRSTDDLFHGLPGADTATTGEGSNGQPITLHSVPLGEHYDLQHGYTSFKSDFDGGKMDGFENEIASAGPGGHIPPDPAYGYVQQSDVQPYFQLAEQYVFADRMFQTNEGPSFPAHQFLISGTSAPAVDSSLLASENPGDPEQTHPLGGCDSPPDMLVTLIDTQGSENYHEYPCFDHQTLMDLMDKKGVSWTYYEPQIGGFWDGPDAISHIRDDPTDWDRVIVPETTILSDIPAGKLAQVSWVIPNGANSDHPSSGTGGPSWVASIVNAVGASQYWDSTAIFITWDDWGGWYDHVAPPIYGSYELGFRVPLIIVSPYAKTGYVSHQQHEFGSILNFVEQNWNLGSLGYTDARSDNFSDCFDFSQSPRPFQTIPALYPRSYFMKPGRVFSPPDND
jgi:phospholipase C